jgi:hypothetical protein
MQGVLRGERQALERLHAPHPLTADSLPRETRQPFGAQPIQTTPQQAQDEEDGEHWLDGIH